MIGDIGCYALGGAAPLNAKDLAVCMGSAFSVGHGFSHGFELSDQKKRVSAAWATRPSSIRVSTP